MDAIKTAEKAKEKLNGKKETAVPKTLTHSKSQQIGDILNLYKAQISQAIPKHVTAERIIQLCTMVIARNPKIKDCDTASIIGAVMQASILGLDVTPQFGQFFFIPRKNKNTGQIECVPLIGYKGYIQLMRRSGEVSTVYAHVVRQGDYFEYEYGLNPKLSHRPADENRGELTHAYAVIRFKDGGFIFEVRTKADVMKAKAHSQAKDSDYSPWNTEEEEWMWRKTAVRGLSNYAPLSAEFITAAVADGVALSPEMFDSKTHQIDPMKIPEVDYEVTDEPEPEKAPEQKTEDKWLRDAKEFKEKIIKHSSEQKFVDELGAMGFESLESVDDEHRPAVMKGMTVLLNELMKTK
jgi:recombination protein RecT